MLRVIRGEREGAQELKKIGVHPKGIDIMLPKIRGYTIKLFDIPPQDALILKQDMLAIGGDIAVAENVLPPKACNSDILIIGTKQQMLRLANKVKHQYERLFVVGEYIETILTNLERKKSIKIGNNTFDFGTRTFIMGIINITPDSFYDGGKYFDLNAALKHAEHLIDNGADIIDVGGESTRPSSKPIAVTEELERVIPFVKKIKKISDVPVSVDTSKPKVAEKALENGADMINDITALKSKSMAAIIRDYDVPIVLMHMKGEPKTMQKNIFYEDVNREIYEFLKERIDFALGKGINEKNIIIDPGIGFGKRTGHNQEDNCHIISHIEEFRSLGFPILIGISQKSFIGNILNVEKEARVEGSLGAEAIAISNGADIIRCHNVLETSRMVKVVDSLIR